MEPQCPQQNQTGYSTCSATSVDKRMVGGWVAKRGRRDQLLALIINGNSLVHALSEELEQDVYSRLIPCSPWACLCYNVLSFLSYRFKFPVHVH
jgi:hypothetical protein